MKFSLFAHMERQDASVAHARIFDELTALVQMAEAGGFEAVWIGEHHGMEFTIAPNPFINIAYLAAKTERIRLGTGTVVAPFWHPIKLAGEAAMTDIVTGGRLDVGIARGAYSFEYARLADGIDPMAAGARLRELVPAVKMLWQGDYAHDGEHWSFPATTCTPQPLQKPHPPLWIAARDPNSHAFAVSNGCNVQVTPLWSGDPEVESLVARFNEACEASPRVPRPRIMLLMHTYVAGSDAEVEEASRALSRYYGLFATWFKNDKPVHRGFIEPPSDEELAATPMYAPQTLRETLVIGTPETVVARLKRFESLGYDQFSLWIDNGMSFEAKRRSLARFIDEVMPAFA
ncbi:MAG: LLM class flavin-dependent oxidoreductase [Gammaproteobacteria bacterium]|nr:LLM class flavin-dependent oxidoreductase [Gammaproteobacteria bacterium]NIM72405.1 LLM class flavin-dependent oxidoreductase [Gammaproteobacteria bacterium]NIN37272.1 LLM class flavin-dependent oxidoreductase [Gammaproteobacteria bacterium]NIO24162.1 LLM class flavin-dependent oxidoreductase [Gammaproteobacteria bacterium]NIO64769.1 LLM class flavin-dependent oxidoreductase [Gammaproteobacteria bacterium]